MPSFAILFLLRIALGLAEAPSFPGAAQTVTRALPPQRRAAGFGVLFTGSSIGAAVSAVLAPTLAEWWGWRVALVGTAAVGLAWIPLWLLATRAAATRAVLEPSGPAHGVPEVAWSSLIRLPAVWRAVAAVVAAAPVNGMILQFGAKLLVTQHGLTQTDVRTYLWLPPLAFDTGAILFGVLASAHARRHPGAPARGLYVGAALLLLGVGLLAVTETPWQTTLAAGLAMAGGGGAYAIATSDMLSRVPVSQVASAGGLTAAAQSLALIVAFPLIGRVVQDTGSYHEVAVGLALWTIPGAAFWLLVKPSPPA